MQDQFKLTPQHKKIRKRNTKSSKKIGSVTAVSTAKARTPSKAGTPITAGTPSAASPLSNNWDAGSIRETARAGTQATEGANKRRYARNNRTSKATGTLAKARTQAASGMPALL